MPQEQRLLILNIFLQYNQGEIKNVAIEEKEIIKSFAEVIEEHKIRHYLDLNTADKLLTRDEMIDPPHYDMIYSLTEKGIQRLFEISGLELNDESDELNEFNSLVYAFLSSNLSKENKDAYESTLNEVVTCIKHNCLNAAISLCGKLLEIYLCDLLNKYNIEIKWFNKGPYDTQVSPSTDLTLNQLYVLAKNKLPDDTKLTSSDKNQIEIIRTFRNGAIHHKENNTALSKNTALGVIHFTSHFLRHRLTWI